jgi:Tfp pilus assembly protein PilN
MRAFNLIPADERGGASLNGGKSGGSAFVVLGLLGVLAIFALLYGQASRQISSQTGKIATLDTQAQAAQAQAARLQPYVSFKTMHEQRVQAVDQLVDSRFDWAHAFHELGRVLPPDEVALTSLNGTIGSSSGSTSAGADTAAGASSKAAAATGATTSAAGSSGSAATSSSSVSSATPAGSVPTFTLAGCATSQAMVALTLDRLRLIDGVSEVTLQSSTQAAKGAGSSSGSGSSSGCSGATFAMQITFDPLPSASAASSSSATPTTTTSALTPTTGTPTTSTGAAR